MDKVKLIEKMQDVISSLRKQLAENDPSAMANMGNSLSMGFQSLKASMSGNDDAKDILEHFKGHMEDFEDALKNGNRMQANKILDDMEHTIQNVRMSTPVI